MGGRLFVVKPKQGRPAGSTKDDAKRGVVRFRCDLVEKGEWVRKARAAGLTLAEWIRGKLNGESR